jgi:hypothetical protein
LQSGHRRTDASEIPHHQLTATRNSTQQTAPGKLHLHVSRNSLQFLGQSLDRTLHKQNVRQTTPGGPAVNLFRNLFEWSTISVDTNEECLRVFLRGLVDKETISGPDVYSYSAIVIGSEFLNGSAVNLSGGSTAN